MSEPSILWPTLTIAVGLSVWIAITRFRVGQILFPMSLALLTLIGIFGIRPLLIIHARTYSWYDMDTSSGFNSAAWTGFLAVVGLSMGHLVSQRHASRIPVRAAAAEEARAEEKGPEEADARSLLRYAFLCLGLVSAWFLAMIVIGGGRGFISVLFAGRTAETAERLTNIPVLVSCIPVAGGIMLCAERLRVTAKRVLTRKESSLFLIALLASVVPPVALGGRRYMVPCLIAAAISTSRSRWSKTLTVRALVGGFCLFLLLATIPFVRSHGSRQGDNLVTATANHLIEEGVTGTLEPVFLSYDTEMFSYISYLAPQLGDSVPYGYGRGTVGDALLNPLPARMSPYPLWSNELLTTVFGAGCTGGKCPVASMPGILLFDFGFPGVLVGSALVGALLARVPRMLYRANEMSNRRLSAALALASFTPVLVRGNTVNVAYLVLMVMVAIAGVSAAPQLRRRLAPGVGLVPLRRSCDDDADTVSAAAA